MVRIESLEMALNQLTLNLALLDSVNISVEDSKRAPGGKGDSSEGMQIGGYDVSGSRVNAWLQYI